MTIFYIVLVLGLSTIIWTMMGLARFAVERRPGRGWTSSPSSLPSRSAKHRPMEVSIGPDQVAVLVAAHNEAVVIAETIRTAARLVPLGNIYLISDESSDRTAAIAAAVGVNVLELEKNRGKAGALAAGIEHFCLCERYEVVLLLDADTRLSADYLATGLPMFQDQQVVAVAGRAKSIVTPAPATALGRFLIAYRERLYVVVQLLLKYGQAARPVNVVSIVPGFASMYRTSALSQIDVAASGLVIEDFNMTFEIHAKKLGRIAFHPAAAVAYTQDPDNIKDYVKQVRRWILGFWQTVRRHGLKPGRFWAVLVVYIIELLASSVFFVLLLPVFLLSALAAIAVATGTHTEAMVFLSGLLRPQDVLVGVMAPDLLLTILGAVVLRRPGYLLMAPFFPLMRILDAAICLACLPSAYFVKSSGAWVSPVRRDQPAAQLLSGRPRTSKLGGL